MSASKAGAPSERERFLSISGSKAMMAAGEVGGDFVDWRVMEAEAEEEETERWCMWPW
jgi:hypothetical protein